MARDWYKIIYYEDGYEYYFCGSFSHSGIMKVARELFRIYPKASHLKIFKNDCYYRIFSKEDLI